MHKKLNDCDDALEYFSEISEPKFSILPLWASLMVWPSNVMNNILCGQKCRKHAYPARRQIDVHRWIAYGIRVLLKMTEFFRCFLRPWNSALLLVTCYKKPLYLRNTKPPVTQFLIFWCLSLFKNDRFIILF